tara:strand:- start:370 stop:867 length:498 start_codon:yes stop_codon:yes gene_type:complete
MQNDELLSTREAADLLQKTPNALRCLRSVGAGPPTLSAPSSPHLHYSKRSLLEWAEKTGLQARLDAAGLLADFVSQNLIPSPNGSVEISELARAFYSREHCRDVTRYTFRTELQRSKQIRASGILFRNPQSAIRKAVDGYYMVGNSVPMSMPPNGLAEADALNDS